jgi:hypothetical protein
MRSTLTTGPNFRDHLCFSFRTARSPILKTFTNDVV